MKHTCDLDKDSVLSYAAIRYDLEKEMKAFEFPSKEEMVAKLQEKNVGLDFKTGKQTINNKTNIDKLKLYYLADYLSKNLGDISKVDRIPYADVVTYSFPCFIPGTMVLTNGGYKNIEDIQEGDMVLTHTNQYQRVVKPMKNYCDSYVYKINAMCGDPIYTTEEHPFYVRKRYRVWNNPKRMYDRKFYEPEWVKAKNLTKDYYVGIAINQKSEIPQWDGTVFKWNNSSREEYSNKLGDYMGNKDFWWIIGRYIGDGWLVDGYGKNPSYGIKICCAKEETSEITIILDKMGVHYNISTERTANKIQISGKEWHMFCSQFGRGAANKRLTSTILNLPIHLLKGFLDGYISADGNLDKKQNVWKATSVSRELMYGIGQCVAKVYATPFSIYRTKRSKTCVIEGRVVNQKDSYNIAFKIDKRKQDNAFYEDGYIWCPIQDISTEKYNGYVYNMEVENDNSYVVQNIIVHNCTDLSVAGKGEGMVNKCDVCGHSWPIDFSNAEEALICPECGAEVSSSTRSGLLGQVQRLLSVAQENNELPKYLLLENVKNLTGKKFIGQFEAWIRWLDSIGYNTYWKVLNAKHYGIPQNRERVFAISIRKDADTNGFTFPEIVPLTTRLKDMLEQNVNEKYYLPDDRIEKIINSAFMQEKKRIQMTDVCDTLLARDWKDPKCVPVEEEPEVKQIGNVCPTKTRDNPNQGRVYDTEGLAPALTTMGGGNREPMIVEEPQVIKVGQASSDGSQSGMVYSPDGLFPTLCAGCHGYAMGNILEEQEPFIVASRGRNPDNPSDRTAGSPTEQRLEPNFSGCTNTLTSVQKDNYVCEPQVLRAERTEYGKAIRKQYEAGEVDEKIGNMREMKPRTDGVANTITTLLKDNYVVEPIVYDDYNGRISKDQNAINTLTTNSGNSAERNGVKILEPIVCEERKDEGIRFFKDDCVGTLRTIDACGDKRVIEPDPQLEFVGGVGDKDWAKDGKQLSRNYPQGSRVYSSDGIASSLTAQGVGGAGGFSGLYAVVENIKWRIRKLTPKCCWRLMNFTDEDHDRAAKYTSASARYKMAGNSIVVACLIAIFSSLFIEDGHKAEVWTKYMLDFKDKNDTI